MQGRQQKVERGREDIQTPLTFHNVFMGDLDRGQKQKLCGAKLHFSPDEPGCLRYDRRAHQMSPKNYEKLSVVFLSGAPRANATDPCSLEPGNCRSQTFQGADPRAQILTDSDEEVPGDAKPCGHLLCGKKKQAVPCHL